MTVREWTGALLSLLLLSASVAGVAAAQTQAQALPSEAASPPGEAWRIIEIDGAPIEAAAPGREPTLSFDAEAGRYAGTIGCNRVVGAYRADGDRLTFSRGAITRMACAPDLMARERALINVLEEARGFRASDRLLEILDSAGRERMTLARSEPEGEEPGEPGTVEPPAPTPAPAPVSAAIGAAQARAPEARTYRVRPGDTLWAIAAREYGEAACHTALARENGIRNAERLRVGRSLRLPERFEETPFSRCVLVGAEKAAPPSPPTPVLEGAPDTAPAPPAQTTAQAAPPAVSTVEITGALLYPERTALPRGAQVALEARGPEGTLLAESRAPADGRQPPIPFSLEVPASERPFSLRAAILVDGVARWISDPAPVTSPDLGALRLSRARPIAFATAYRCGLERIEVGVVDDAMTLRAGGRDYPLAPAALGSQTRVARDGGAETSITARGDAAEVVIEGRALTACRRIGANGGERDGEPARRPTVTARGVEPGWSLDIAEGRLRLVTDYGAETLEIPAPEPTASDSGRRYAAPDHQLEITVEDSLCRDAATGMPHPQRVSVSYRGRTLEGCGGAPASLLAGAEWVVEDIGGQGIIDGSRVTLFFVPEQRRVSGRASCNSFTAPFQLSGEGVSIGDAAVSQRACVTALMRQERRFLDLLSAVTRFDLDDTGALALITPDGRTILARR